MAITPANSGDSVVVWVGVQPQSGSLHYRHRSGIYAERGLVLPLAIAGSGTKVWLMLKKLGGVLLTLMALGVGAADSGPAANGVPERESRLILGWTVHVHKALLATNAVASTRALALLETQLEEIARVVPPAALSALRQVPLWLSPEYSGVQPRAEYHPNAQWLSAHDRNPAMAQGVEFTNIRIFEAETRRMPNFALHELAHAYHDRVLGNHHAEIKATYQRAQASGQYDRVEQRFGNGRGATVRAYAISNPQEYFAESTEAFFSTNDFFPFTREELKRHDPEMFELLKRLWGVPTGTMPR